jgi:hypothetical protein
VKTREERRGRTVLEGERREERGEREGEEGARTPPS